MNLEFSKILPHDLNIYNHKIMLDSLNIGYALLDMDENILEVNKTLSRMTNSKRQNSVGYHLSDLYEKEEYETLTNINLKLQKQLNYQFEYFIRKSVKDGEEKIPVLFNISHNLDHAGNPVTQNVMITDISELKRIQAELRQAYQSIMVSHDKLKAEKNKLETILFGIGDCVTIFDQEGKLLFCNPKGKEIRGHQKMPFLPLDLEKQKEITLSVKSDQRRFLGQVEAIYGPHGSVYAYVEILKDLTDQMKLQEKEKELFQVRREIKRATLETKMIGRSSVMRKVFDLILRCAEVDSTILITGDTGVGKEMAARAIHRQSGREDQPFIAISCGALPDTLLESELFGYVKGAFTGAIKDRLGMFREANGGTIFLDEIGDLSRNLQVKLLRALQEREIRPLGSDRSYAIDVRVLAATNKDLKQLVAESLFREDLYYRLAVIPLVIPPLSERHEDIFALLEHFIKKHRNKNHKSVITFDKGAQHALLNYAWPGNVRELENCVEYSLAMAQSNILTFDDLPLQITSDLSLNSNPAGTLDDGTKSGEQRRTSTVPEEEPTFSMTLLNQEKQSIMKALHLHGHNKTRAARELGISRSTIIRKINKYRLDTKNG